MKSFLYKQPFGGFEVNLMEAIAYYESQFFRDVKPISSAEFIENLDGPARVLPQIDRIELNACLAPFEKLCCFLVLHELINNKLYKILGSHPGYKSEEYKAEVKRLWGAEAYADLL